MDYSSVVPLVHSHSLDLFDRVESPLSAYEEAFNSWLVAIRENGRFSDSSEEAYRHLWGVLVKWALAQQPVVRFTELSSGDLEAFIASRCGQEDPDSELSPRYVWRLLHLVDRVLATEADRSGAQANTAASDLLKRRPEWRYANAADADLLPEYLNAAQAKQLVTFLSAVRPRRSAARAVVHTWQELRNVASLGLQLGAGLSPGEVRSLVLSSAISEGGRLKGVPWKIVVPAKGISPSRETPIAPWAGQLLSYWLQVRAEADIAGSYLFPSTRTGKPWGKVAQYDSSKRVLEAAGFDEGLVRGGSFRLRHTFALRQLRRGKSPEDVARWLGVVDPAVMARYQRVFIAPIDDLA